MDTRSAVLTPIRKVLGPAYDPLRRTELRLECMVRHRSEDAMAEEAQRYWEHDVKAIPQFSHFRGAGIFGDDERWLTMGRRHLRMYSELLATADDPPPLRRMIEWGAGGGANAVLFAPLTDEFVGVDVARENLDECGRQLESEGFDGYVPVLVPVAEPERAKEEIPGPAELFLSTYVFEVFPTQEYGWRVLRLAHDLLVDRGLAIVQVKIVTSRWDTRPRRFSYKRNLGHLTSYAVEEFWSGAEEAGFDPVAVKLLARDPVNENGPYAYFLLQKSREVIVDLRDR